MYQSGKRNPRSTGLMLLLVGVVLIGFFIWSAYRGRGQAGSDSTRRGDIPGRVQAARGDGGESTSGSPDKTTAGKRPGVSDAPEQEREVPQFPMLDQVLSDGGLSNGEAAVRLLEIVVKHDISLLEREEALAHGLDLDLSRFLEIVADPQLPQPLAQRFFDEMLNHNDKRDLQVRACIALMDHENPALRQDATEQLAFYIGLEEWSEKPDVLRQEAYAFLEDWAKRPKPEPVPLDPGAEIPETAPFTPPQPDEEEDGEE